MNKQEIIKELEKAAHAAFGRVDGTLNYNRLKLASGLEYYQIKSIFDETKKPSIDSIIAFAKAVNKKIEIV